MKAILAVAGAAALVVGGVTPALAQPRDVPRTAGFVMDGALVIPDNVDAAIERRLRAHQQRTTNEIVVMTVPGIGGLTIEQFSRQVFNTLGIGVAGRNNGVLIFVTAEDRKLRIQVGTGLSKEITAAETKAILDGRMVPALRAGDFGRAVKAGVEGVLIELGDAAPIADEPPPQDARPGGAPGNGLPGLPDVSDSVTRIKDSDLAGDAMKLIVPIGGILLVTIVTSFIARIVRGMTGVVNGVTDMAGAAGYGRGVWFGGPKQANPYAQGGEGFGAAPPPGGEGFVTAPPLAAGSSVGVAAPVPPAAAAGPVVPILPPGTGGVSGGW